ncbi:MAG TPA: response regulator transcription factor [Bryobacteraceae bacterium]|jgi:DNA-binding response OmpR family regulator|nr:response regulator transcription factor [Bryobacteraceae bacterium]
MPKILLIDDDETVCEALSLMLEREGFAPLLAHDGESGFEKALTLKPQLVLVDLRLPGMSGVELCKQLRAANAGIPIIVLSGLDEELDKVLLLEIGADDYVVKPFSPRELLARIRAVLRRASAIERVVRFGEVEVDLDRRLITRRGQEINLTRQEYNLLTFFLNNADRALSRDAILNAVWGFESYPNTRTVDAHVVRLRQKLEPNPATPRHVLTIHGLGYRFSI